MMRADLLTFFSNSIVLLGLIYFQNLSLNRLILPSFKFDTADLILVIIIFNSFKYEVYSQGIIYRYEQHSNNKKRRSGAVTDLLKFLEDKLSYKIKRKKIISKNIKYR